MAIEKKTIDLAKELGKKYAPTKVDFEHIGETLVAVQQEMVEKYKEQIEKIKGD